MRLLDALKRPAVRVPVVLAAVLGVSLLAARSCREHFRIMDLARRRHQSFILLLAAAVRDRPEPPSGLGELAWRPEPGSPSGIEQVFRRDFAGRPEFAGMAVPGSSPLGDVRVWQGSDRQGQEQEILWSDYMFRLYRDPGGSREFAIFSWPLSEGPAQLTLAWLSAQPDRIYYTSAPRYVGPERGPTLADLGEAPFEGRVFLLSPDALGDSPRDFIARAEERNGRIWAVESLGPPTRAPRR